MIDDDDRRVMGHFSVYDDSDSDDDLSVICCGCTDHDTDDVLLGDPDSTTKFTNSLPRPPSLRSYVKHIVCSKLARLVYFMVVLWLLYIFYTVLIFDTRPAKASTDLQASSNKQADIQKALNVIGGLCTDYRNGIVAGELCASLCSNPNYTITDYIVGGTKIVIKYNQDSKDQILKMNKAKFADYDQLDFRISHDEFTDIVLDVINEQTKLGWPHHYKEHLMRLIWPGYKGVLSRAERASIWALVNQDEFVNFKILLSSRALPTITNTCGQVYGVEYLIPFKMKGYYVNLKAKILLHLIGTLKLFDEFLNEPLHFCDTKFENLGLSSRYPKRFMVMDADMLYTESALQHKLTSTKCKEDSDCGIFDCESRCDQSTGFCTQRTNDNIDVFCKKLINAVFGRVWSKNNRYLAACHESPPVNATKRLNELRLTWAWSLAEV